MTERPEKVQIIDLRQADYVGGHLRGSMHIPYDKFTEQKAEELVKLLVGKKDIVFLCMYSKTLAPECASKYARTRLKYIEDQFVENQNVLVLLGGMSIIMTVWFCAGTAGGLIVGYDENMWKIETSIGLIHIYTIR